MKIVGPFGFGARRREKATAPFAFRGSNGHRKFKWFQENQVLVSACVALIGFFMTSMGVVYSQTVQERYRESAKLDSDLAKIDNVAVRMNQTAVFFQALAGKIRANAQDNVNASLEDYKKDPAAFKSSKYHMLSQSLMDEAKAAMQISDGADANGWDVSSQVGAMFKAELLDLTIAHQELRRTALELLLSDAVNKSPNGLDIDGGRDAGDIFRIEEELHRNAGVVECLSSSLYGRIDEVVNNAPKSKRKDWGRCKAENQM